MAVQTALNLDFISTHSLTRRLTTSTLLFFSSDLYFNSQPHKEADSAAAAGWLRSVHFNSQPHKEADKTTRLHRISSPSFQLTASQGG